MALRMMPLKRQAASMAVRSMSSGEWRAHLTLQTILAPALAGAAATAGRPLPM